MSQIHFIGGEKGGVGKSTVARLLVQHCIDENRDFAVLDADQSHGEMQRFYADFTRSVNLQDDDDADRIFEAADEREQSVIIDLPAQCQRQLSRWLSEAGILELAREEGIAVTFWHIMDDGKDSVALLERLLDYYTDDDNVEFVVVRNEGVGTHFRHFEQSQAFDKARRRGARFLVLPALNRKVMNKIDHMDLSFWAAAFRADGDSLSLLERQRVKVWRRRWNEQLAQVADRLTPPRSAGVVRLHAAE
jgi:adenylate kinase family enzyme